MSALIHQEIMKRSLYLFLRVWLSLQAGRAPSSTVYGYNNHTCEHGNRFCLYPFAPENLVSRDKFCISRPIKRQPIYSAHRQAESSGCSRAPLNLAHSATTVSQPHHQTPSQIIEGRSSINPVSQLRADSFHRQEYDGSWSIVSNIARVTMELCLLR